MTRTRVTVTRTDAAMRAGFAAIRSEHQVPEAFGAGALGEAMTLSEPGPPATWLTAGAERIDQRDVPFVTIDPPGSKDLDQAMHIARRAGGYRVRYAIADVAAVVSPGGLLDGETHRRAMTVYCPDERVPLHPPVLSEGSSSLLDGQDRAAVVWTLDLDPEGALVGTDVRRAVVRSRQRLDYAAAQRTLDDPHADRSSTIALLGEVGVLRAEQERQRGGVSLARPEQEVVPGPDGWSVTYRTPLPVEEHNAQISLLAGMAGASLMLEARIGVLRTMPTATPEAVARLRHQALALGVAWPGDEPYASVLARLPRGEGSTAAFLAAATVLYRGAAWTAFDGSLPAETTHGALAAPYAHVTAPLRRMVDRYGLEVCLAVVGGRAVPGWVHEALPHVGGWMADGARRTAAVDRACTDLVEASVLAPRVGSVFDAVAIDSGTVQLTDPAVVAPCGGGDLPVGERVHVRLTEADPVSRTVRFTWARPS